MNPTSPGEVSEQTKENGFEEKVDCRSLDGRLVTITTSTSHKGYEVSHVEYQEEDGGSRAN